MRKHDMKLWRAESLYGRYRASLHYAALKGFILYRRFLAISQESCYRTREALYETMKSQQSL